MAIQNPVRLQPPFGAQWRPGTLKVQNIVMPVLTDPNAGGLAFYPHQRSYEGSSLSAATVAVIQFRAMRSGFIRNVYLWVPSVTGSGISYYNIFKNGAALWTGADRLAVTSANSFPLKESLSIPVTRGDMLTLDLETFAAGQVHSAPIALLIETE